MRCGASRNCAESLKQPDFAQRLVDLSYDAIGPAREIRYDAYFQCLDCVGIYHDPRSCARILLYGRKAMILTPKGVILGGSGG